MFDSNPIVILLSGAPGSGKSTVQRAAPRYFREKVGECAAIGMDEIYTLIDPDWIQTNDQWGRISCDNCLLLAKNFLHHGFKVVLMAGNGLYHPEVINIFLSGLLSVSRVYHFTLDVQQEVVVERVRKRGDLKEHPPEWLAAWLALVRSHHGSWTEVIDTSACTANEILEIIHARVLVGKGVLGLLSLPEENA